jgi:hypothetical protein
MTTKIKTDDMDKLELDTEKSTVTSKHPSDDARKVYASYLKAAQKRHDDLSYEHRVLGTPAVQEAFVDARGTLDAFKQSL